MAGHSRYTVVIDACVLFGMRKTDALMSLCSRGLFAARWSTRIEDEWISALAKTKPIDKLTRRRDHMRDAVPDWEVPDAAVAAIEPCLHLPDEGDRHVLAAAISGHADCIITDNLKHFPLDYVGSFGIEVLDPDTFIINQIDLDEYQALAAFKVMRARLVGRKETSQDFAKAFERHGLIMTAQRLLDRAELL